MTLFIDGDGRVQKKKMQLRRYVQLSLSEIMYGDN
jgi:hypothetical protein